MNKMLIENENNEYKSLSDLKEELGSNYEVYLYGATISAIEEINRLQQELNQKNKIIDNAIEYMENEIIIKTIAYDKLYEILKGEE